MSKTSKTLNIIFFYMTLTEFKKINMNMIKEHHSPKIAKQSTLFDLNFQEENELFRSNCSIASCILYGAVEMQKSSSEKYLVSHNKFLFIEPKDIVIIWTTKCFVHPINSFFTHALVDFRKVNYLID